MADHRWVKAGVDARRRRRAPRRSLRAQAADPVYRYAYSVILAGTAAVAVAALHGAFGSLAHPTLGLFAILAMAFGADLVALRLPGQVDDMRFSASNLAAYTALLMFGTGAAVVVFAGTGAVNDALVRRLAPIKTAFNAAQYAISMLVTGWVLHLDGGFPAADGSRTVVLAHVPALIASGAALLVTNNALSMRVSAMAMGVRFRDHLRNGLPAVLVDGALVAFTPIVVIVADAGVGLLPLLGLPFAALFWSGRQADRRRHDAQHDALTGLPNRTMFRARLHQELERTRHAGGRVDVLLLDLDGFKEINDTLGHGHGDEVLRLVAARLKGLVRPTDVVARLGGDEFGAVILGLEGETQLHGLAERLRSALDEPVVLGDLHVRAGASIGMACWPEHGGDAETLLRHADVAMYAAKGDRSGCELYDRDRDPYSPERLELLGELRNGIRRGEIVLHYQPKLCLRSGRVKGVEALARWQHPQRGLLGPGAFIELAEQSDLMGALTNRVLRDALAQAAAWETIGLDLSVAVNLSPDTLLDEALPAAVERALADRSLSPDRLQLEITESSLMRDAQRAAKVLEGLRAAGVRVSIDDFGTGYSSLAWLKRLPVHEIKIDRSFVSELAPGSSDAAIVESTVRLGQTLGMTVVAEGVETQAALDLLRGFGCDVAQGYLVSRPQPADEVTAWLLAEREAAGAAPRLRAA
jgi:diguanylate cyclase (GGDEF)-like protein